MIIAYFNFRYTILKMGHIWNVGKIQMETHRNLIIKERVKGGTEVMPLGSARSALTPDTSFLTFILHHLH